MVTGGTNISSAHFTHHPVKTGDFLKMKKSWKNRRRNPEGYRFICLSLSYNPP